MGVGSYVDFQVNPAKQKALWTPSATRLPTWVRGVMVAVSGTVNLQLIGDTQPDLIYFAAGAMVACEAAFITTGGTATGISIWGG